MKLLFLKILFIFIICRPIFAMQMPGQKYFIDINKLAKPYATKSASNSHHNLDVEIISQIESYYFHIFVRKMICL